MNAFNIDGIADEDLVVRIPKRIHHIIFPIAILGLKLSPNTLAYLVYAHEVGIDEARLKIRLGLDDLADVEAELIRTGIGVVIDNVLNVDLKNIKR